MSLLFSQEIKYAIDQELALAKDSVQIISAYCKLKALVRMNDIINKSVSLKKLMVRFRADDIVKGSTDFEILDFCMKNGWEVYIRFDLHAKTYIVDDKRGIVGSSNATLSGLGISKSANYEMGSLVEIEKQDILKIEKMYMDAIKVDEKLICRLKEELSINKNEFIDGSFHWSSSITKLFHPQINTLFSYELPENKSISEGYVSFLDVPKGVDKSQLKELFRWCNAYLWLLQVLKENQGCLYFGALTERLHNALVEDPKPYRREVKELLSNLLSWVEELEMEEIVIDRPNYSQRIRIL